MSVLSIEYNIKRALIPDRPFKTFTLQTTEPYDVRLRLHSFMWRQRLFQPWPDVSAAYSVVVPGMA